MNKMSKDKRDKLLLVCIGAIGLCSVLYFLIITDDQDVIAELGQKMVAVQVKKANSESLLKKQADKEAALEEAKKVLMQKQTDMFKPGEKDHVRYLQILTKRSFTNNLTVDKIVLPEVTEAGVLPQFPFTAQRIHVVMLGAYQDFGRFLAEFENAYPYIRVQGLGIQPDIRVQMGATPTDAASVAATEQLRFEFNLIVLVGSQL